MTDQVCNHIWLYADFTNTPNPPQRPKICLSCGLEGADVGIYAPSPKYHDTKAKFDRIKATKREIKSV